MQNFRKQVIKLVKFIVLNNISAPAKQLNTTLLLGS